MRDDRHVVILVEALATLIAYGAPSIEVSVQRVSWKSCGSLAAIAQSGSEELVQIERPDWRDRLDDVAEVRPRVIAGTRIDVAWQTLVVGGQERDHRMERLTLSRRITTPSSPRSVLTSDPSGKKLIALTKAFTSAVFSFVPASRARMRHACSGVPGA